MTSIGTQAFYDCSGLKDVCSYIVEPFEINKDVFGVNRFSSGDSPFNTATLYVPVGTKGKYEETPAWNMFQNIVEDEPSSVPKGDANGDGEVNITDITYIIDKINDMPAANFNKKAADLNEDGEINITDVTLLLDIINGVK